MRLVTWNVNSIRQRLPRLLAHAGPPRPRRGVPAGDEGRGRGLPHDGAPGGRVRGRDVRTEGVQRRRDPVSRKGLEDVQLGLRRRPRARAVPRRLGARVGDLRRRVRLRRQRQGRGRPRLRDQARVARCARERGSTSTRTRTDPSWSRGDFNVAPDDRDVWDRGALAREEPGERTRARARPRVCSRGGSPTSAAPRPATCTGPFSYWDYTAGAFHEGGACGSTSRWRRRPWPSGSRSVMVERDERKPTFGEGKPSATTRRSW